MRDAIIYCRVSTDHQAKSGLGLEAQERRCREYAEALGWRVRAVHRDEGISGATPTRKGLQAAINALGPGDVLLGWDLTRYTRTASDFEAVIDREVRRRGAEIVSVSDLEDTDTASGWFVRHLKLGLGEFERRVISERTRSALAVKRSRRERLGSTPLGFRTLPDGTLEEIPEEMEAVRRARELRGEGLTLQAIADTLTAEGRPTKRGGRWHPKTVRGILGPRYVETIGVA